MLSIDAVRMCVANADGRQGSVGIPGPRPGQSGGSWAPALGARLLQPPLPPLSRFDGIA